MKKHQISSRYWRGVFNVKFVIALLVAIGISLVVNGIVEISSAQSKQDELEYGVTYSCPQMNNYEFKVNSCDKGWCQVFIVNKNSPNGGNITGQGRDSILSLIEKNECAIKGRATVKEKAEQTERADKNENGDKQTPILTKDKTIIAGDCSSDASLTAKPKANDSMELKSKRAILALFQKSVDRGETVAVGISFESFQIGPPRINRRGETLYYEDAPVGSKIYPIKSKFNVCSLFSTEITHDVYDGRYECFKDNFGEWACAPASGNRKINTTYEKIKK